MSKEAEGEVRTMERGGRLSMATGKEEREEKKDAKSMLDHVRVHAVYEETDAGLTNQILIHPRWLQSAMGDGRRRNSLLGKRQPWTEAKPTEFGWTLATGWWKNLCPVSS